MILAPVVLAAAAWTMDGGDITPKYAEVPVGIEAYTPHYAEVPIGVDAPGVQVDPKTNVPIEKPIVADPTLPPPADPIPGMELEISAGGVGAFTGDMDAAIKPFVRLRTTTPLPILSDAKADWWPRGYVMADFTGLPGRSVVLTDLNTYNTVEVRLGISQACFQNKFQRLGLFAEGGFATRLQGGEDAAPLNRTVRWGSGGISIEQKEGKAWIRAGIGGDQRLTADYSYAAAVILSGQVRVWTEDVGAMKNVGISIGGEASLGMSSGYYTQTRRDIVRVWVAVSR